VATRREPITGTSEFPNINEADVSVLLPMPTAEESTASSQSPSSLASAETAFASLVQIAGQGASLPQLAGTASGPSPVSIASLPSIRTAEPFERLRDLSDAHRAKTGERPRIFLANLGPIAAFTARATFVKNFFEAGGIEAVMSDGFISADEMRAGFVTSGTEMACLCSSDEIYFGAAEAAIVPHETFAEEAASALKRAGCKQIYMAGRSIIREEALRCSGIHDFIYTGCDHLHVLRAIHTTLVHQPFATPEAVQS
jgi:methylmalonyl-CoA mutase